MKIPTLKKPLYPFQKKGVRQVYKKFNMRCLIGDDMGLGKTIQALALAEISIHHKPCIIVCPSSLKYKWADKLFEFFGNSNSVILSGRSAYGLSGYDYYIINYDVLNAWKVELLKMNPKLIVADECHYAKNKKAQRTKALKFLTKKIPYFVPLSGTPILKKPMDIWTVLNMIDPIEWASDFKFGMRYCAGHRNRWGWDFTGASNIAELNTKLKSYMIRRTKEEVLTDLPERIRTVLPLEIDNRKEYKEIKKDCIKYLKKIDEEKADRATRAEQLVKASLLRKVTAMGKVKQSIEWIKDYLETGKKLVVFYYHNDIGMMIKNEFKNSVMVKGGMKPKDKDTAMNKFQDDKKVNLFIGQIQAASEGLDLYAADTLAFIEFGNHSEVHRQAEDRIRRIGQKAEKVFIYYLIAKNTHEKEQCERLQAESENIEKILDGKEVDKLGNWDIFDIIQEEMK